MIVVDCEPQSKCDIQSTALLARALYYDLVELAVEEGDQLVVWSGGARFVLEG